MKTYSSDIVIIGAGPAGAHLSSLLARSGFTVSLLDKNPKGASGATWVNGIPNWVFDEAGLDKPSLSELHAAGSRFTLIDPTHHSRVSILAPFLLDVDMRVFGERLVKDALRFENVKIFHDTLIKEFELDLKGRPLAAISEDACFKAALFVDASGLAGILRKQTPFLKELCPSVQPSDLCRAAQEVHTIVDPHKALAFLESNKAQSGEILSWVGVAGGFSLLRVQVSPDLKTVAFLTGTRALFGVPSGAKLIQNFMTSNTWVGEKIFGGSRAIPLRHPYAHLVAPGVALIGDSACQVFSVHGSGVAMGLIAAKKLAAAVTKAAHSGLDIGSLSALWPYAYAFHSKYGAILAISDMARRFSQKLSPYEVHQFISAGLLTEGLLKSSLLQQAPVISLDEISAQLKALTRYPTLGLKLASVFSRFPKIYWACKKYPKEPDLQQAIQYEKRIAQLI